jgi:hypothetical protein
MLSNLNGFGALCRGAIDGNWWSQNGDVTAQIWKFCRGDRGHAGILAGCPFAGLDQGLA